MLKRLLFRILQNTSQIFVAVISFQSMTRSRYTDAELTSRVSEVDIAKIEKQLNAPWSPRPDFKKLEQTAVPIDILLATNMISLG